MSYRLLLLFLLLFLFEPSSYAEWVERGPRKEFVEQAAEKRRSSTKNSSIKSRRQKAVAGKFPKNVGISGFLSPFFALLGLGILFFFLSFGVVALYFVGFSLSAAAVSTGLVLSIGSLVKDGWHFWNTTGLVLCSLSSLLLLLLFFWLLFWISFLSLL